MQLHEQLTERRNASAQNLPAEILQIMVSETKALKAKALEQHAPKVGDIFPNFALGNQTNDEIQLAATFVMGRDGKVIYANVNADYTYRAEPSDIVDVLTSIN